MVWIVYDVIENSTSTKVYKISFNIPLSSDNWVHKCTHGDTVFHVNEVTSMQF